MTEEGQIARAGSGLITSLLQGAHTKPLYLDFFSRPASFACIIPYLSSPGVLEDYHQGFLRHGLLIIEAGCSLATEFCTASSAVRLCRRIRTLKDQLNRHPAI